MATRTTVWISTAAGVVAILAATLGGVSWIRTNVAWAEDVKQSFVLQSINVQRIQLDDREWRIRHDLEDIEARKKAGESWTTDEQKRRQLEQEQRFVLEQRGRLQEAERAAVVK